MFAHLHRSMNLHLTGLRIPAEWSGPLAKARHSFLCLVSLKFLIFYPLLALDPSKELTQYKIVVWEAEDGLPQNSVPSVMQSFDGYIWMGSEGGLVRFDGRSFRVWDRSNAEGLQKNNIWTIAQDSYGYIWCGTIGGGVSRFDGVSFQTYTIYEDLPDNQVTALAVTDSNEVWIGTHKGLARIDASGVIKFSESDGIGPNSITYIYADGENTWVAYNDQLALISRNIIRHQPLPDNLIVTCVYRNRGGQLLLGGSNGEIYIQDGKAFRQLLGSGAMNSRRILTIFEDEERTLWIGTSGDGLLRYRESQLSSLTIDNGLSSNFINSITEDHEHNLWLGTYNGGVIQLSDGKFVNYTVREGMQSNIILSVSQADDDAMWVGTYGGGLTQIHDDQIRHFGQKQGLSDHIITTVMPGHDGSIWAGTHSNGLSRYYRNRFYHYTTEDGLPDNSIISLYQATDSTLWIGTQNGGLSTFKDGRFSTITLGAHTNNAPVIAILEDHAGQIWLGTDGSGLVRYSPREILSFSRSDGLPSDQILALYEDRSGVLWIGTDGEGISRLKEGQFFNFSTQDGLFSDISFFITEDYAQNLWISSNKGIYRVRKADINNFADRLRKRIPVTTFTKADGMPASECLGRRQPAGWKDKQGQIWFPTIEGLTCIDPDNIPENRFPPPVVIEEVEIDGQYYDPSGYIILDPGASVFTFRFSALSYAIPEKVRVRYMLEGFDKDWIEKDPSYVPRYTNLSPGEYTFWVSAANSDGVWNSEDVSFTFRVQPFFSQTPLFYTLVIGALLLAIIGVIRYVHLRMAIKQRRLTYQVTERTRALKKEIFERVRAEKALEAEKKQLSVTLSSIAEGVITTNVEERVVLLNTAAEQMTGWSSEEALERPIEEVFQLIDAETREAVENQARQILDSGEVSDFSDRSLLISRDGRERYIAHSGAPIKDKEGRILGVVIIFRDISERVRTETELLKINKLESVGMLAGGIAHDFNNILTALWGNLSLAKALAEGQEQLSQNLEESEKAMLRARDLTKQLLTFSKGGAPVMKAASIAHLIDETTAFLLSGSNVQYCVEHNEEPEDIRPVHIDEGQISQVLNNIIINATQAMPDGGQLTISLANETITDENPMADVSLQAGDYVKISITDTGQGIAAQILEQIFDPYFSTKDDGSGLGLAISYSIVKNHGGYLSVETLEGSGTTFHIYLPATDEMIVVESEPANIAIAGGGKILVMDDEESIREIVGQALDFLGYEVAFAEEGVQAVDLYMSANEGQKPFDAVILDLTIPGGMGGKETMERIIEYDPDARVLVSSGYSNDPIMAEYDKFGFCGVIEKPFDVNTLGEALSNAIQKSEENNDDEHAIENEAV